jgi:hypothetical protein
LGLPFLRGDESAIGLPDEQRTCPPLTQRIHTVCATEGAIDCGFRTRAVPIRHSSVVERRGDVLEQALHLLEGGYDVRVEIGSGAVGQSLAALVVT